MKRIGFAVCLFVLCLLCTGAFAYTLTFDDVLAGSPACDCGAPYGAFFSGGFTVAHHSGENVLVFNADFYGMLKFREPANLDQPYSVYSLGAYFSTAPGTVIRIDGCHNSNDQVVASMLVGSSTEAWNKRFAEINDPMGRIDYFMFYPVSSDDALLHWSADDMTVDPVPEPSSLLAILAGLGGCGMLLRRKPR